MNATQTQTHDRERIFDDTVDKVSRFLHPLVSPYDLSDSNREMQYRNNPNFHRVVKEIAYLLIKRQETSDDMAIIAMIMNLPHPPMNRF